MKPHSAESTLGWSALGMATVVGASLMVCGCQQGLASRSEGGAPAAAASGAPAPLPVKLVAVERWPATVRVQGSLVADEHVVVGAKVAGRVSEVPVDIGDAVAANAVLMKIETSELDLKVRQAKAQLGQALARLGMRPEDREESFDPHRVPAVLQEEALKSQAAANLARAESLARDRVIAAEDLQDRRAAAEVAEARYNTALNDVQEQLALIGLRRVELALAEQTLADSVVRAPFEGVVEKRFVAPGAYVQVGEPVVGLVRIDPLRFHAGVPERDAMRIRRGQEVRITVEGLPEPIVATITRISPGLETSNRSLVIEADVPNPSGATAGGESRPYDGPPLLAGLFAEAEIPVEGDSMALPASAIRQFAGVEKVFRVRDGQAEEQIIHTGRRAGDRVEVLEGVALGDTVILDAQKARRGPVVVEGQATAAGRPAHSSRTQYEAPAGSADSSHLGR